MEFLGKLAKGGFVPWEYQSINTLPDNFIWEKNSSQILTVAKGIYEIQYGFFGARFAEVELLINGESISLS